MQIEEGYLYHIYNQGNNRRRIFYSKSNYEFFLNKIEVFVKPYADIIAYCLMPNHFHLMVYVKHESIFIESLNKNRSINHSIGILLRSYTRAINKQENMSGSLFRKETKAQCINGSIEKISNSDSTSFGQGMNFEDHAQQYPQVCFNYIHQNPVKAGLVMKIQDWEFSSAKEYFKNTIDGLISKERAVQFIDLEFEY